MPSTTLDKATAATAVAAHHLRSLTVSGGFLDGQKFEFADGLNCITGPKGAGKTTVIEFVRFVLDAPPAGRPDAGERERLDSLVAANLGTGRIELAVETKEGIPYTITRTLGEDPLVLTAEGEPTAISPSHGLFAADVFSVNEIESIAENPAAQLALLDGFESERVGEITAQIGRLQDQLSANAAAMVPLEDRLTKLNIELDSQKDIDDRISALAATQVGSLKALDDGHKEKALLERQQKSLLEAQDYLERVAQGLQSFMGKLPQDAKRHFEKELLHGLAGEIMGRARQELMDYAQELDELMRRAKEATAQRKASLVALAREMAKIASKHELEFRKLQDQHEAAKAKSAERSKLERQRNVLLGSRREQRNVVHDLGELRGQREGMLRELSSLWDKRSSIRQQTVKRINASLMPAIRVTLAQKADRDAYRGLLQECLKGSHMKWTDVSQKLSDTFSPPELVEIIRQGNCQRLVEGAQVNDEQAAKTIAGLAESPQLFEIQSIELGDCPTIELLDHDIYKDSLHVSSGQKCTAILPILMLDSSNPLLIDQPEENLDAGFIYETMVATVLKMKLRRQMLFVTHNPNIPVLGDAEMFFKLESNGKQTRITMRGSVEQLRRKVMDLEGGPEAFEKRMKRYGY